ncbi:MAG: glycosyltransferase [Fibrobacter sp.]|uniref:glycosyltransferase n=1 Tax=Fibrobacter sp. TaxID=35828 RepID=UPI002A9156ED|nr:glycosyltransferase [Fibrobacter sp.]MDY6263413.1 glycosyltransferase [Fibrobacter sp.]
MISPTNTCGGAERIFAQLANYFVSQSIEVVYVCFDSKSSFYKLEKNVVLKKMNLEFKSKVFFFKLMEAPIVEVKRFLYIRKLMKVFKPDLTIPFLEVAELLTIPNCLMQKIPFCVSIRNDYGRYRRYMKILARLTYRKAKVVVCQTKEIEHSLLKSVKCKTAVIPNPIDETTYAQEPFKGERRKVIINVGRLTAQKNQKLLISAFKNVVREYPDYELHIYGKGELLSTLQKYVNNQKLHNYVSFKNIEFNVLLNNRDVSLFVMSSDYEGFPNALVEAMANGIPVISTDFKSCAARELLDGGLCGGVVPIGDKDRLEKEIMYALSHPDVVAKKAEKGLYVRKELNSKKICKKWLQVLV